jgi:hypothetical protein
LITNGLTRESFLKAVKKYEGDPKGLSLTPDLATARVWATWRAKERGQNPMVIEAYEDELPITWPGKGKGKGYLADPGEVFILVDDMDRIRKDAFRICQ